MPYPEYVGPNQQRGRQQGRVPPTAAFGLERSTPLDKAAGGAWTRAGWSKYIWSDFDGFRRAGGSHPPTPTPAPDGGGLAPTPSLPSLWVGATDR
jgi:hypothetical protein